MSQSLVKNLIHLVYSTKYRKPWIPAAVRAGLYAYQAGIFKNWDSPALLIGGTEDHVHALLSLSKNHAMRTVVQEVKQDRLGVDEDRRFPQRRFSMAGRLRRLLRERVKLGGRAAAY